MVCIAFTPACLYIEPYKEFQNTAPEVVRPLNWPEVSVVNAQADIVVFQVTAVDNEEDALVFDWNWPFAADALEEPFDIQNAEFQSSRVSFTRESLMHGDRIDVLITDGSSFPVAVEFEVNKP
jgi:hypothetical protein